MTRPLLRTGDPFAGWRSVAQRGLEIYSIPGSHWTMFREPHVHTLAETLRRCLETTNSRP
jgi:thioesterase domain-containing protein